MRKPNRPPVIDSFESSLTTLFICPFKGSTASSVSANEPEVDLVVKASDPDGDSLSYEYSTTEGTISGKGRSVHWDLHRVLNGPHEVRVTVTDGEGGKVDAALTVTTEDASGCDPPPPPCPVIKVSCPAQIEKPNSVVFPAKIEIKAEGYKPTYSWELNASTIIKGQNTAEIQVSTAGANGFDNITATVEVGGFDPACTGTTVSCTTTINR